MIAQRALLAVVVAVGLNLAGFHPAAAQSFPSKLIKIVVPFPPGGPSDVAARLMAQPLGIKIGRAHV